MFADALSRPPADHPLFPIDARSQRAYPTFAKVMQAHKQQLGTDYLTKTEENLARHSSLSKKGALVDAAGRLYVPPEERKNVLRLAHDQVGHFSSFYTCLLYTS